MRHTSQAAIAALALWCAAAASGIVAAPATATARNAGPSERRENRPLGDSSQRGKPAGRSPAWRPDVAAARAYARSRPGVAAFAVRTERRLYGWRVDRGFPSASVLKPMLLAAYLRQGSVRDRALRRDEKALLAPMIRRSDDAAASAILGRVGHAGLLRLAHAAGMSGFKPAAPIWGLSRITARDQTRFFLHVDDFLPPRHRAYGLRLLRTVVDSQRWGIGRLKLPGWRVYFKGGWGSGSGAVDHQVALLVRGEERLSVAVLTVADGTHATGKATLEGLFRRLLRGLPAPQSRATAAQAAQAPWTGYVRPIAQVGKLSGRGDCTGTVVGRSLVLTAAHCVAGARRIRFAPGIRQHGTSYDTPFGVWTATRWWTPAGYRAGDRSLDYALVEIRPRRGRRIGDLTGLYDLEYGARAPVQAFVVGYPASGWFVSGGRRGVSPYACSETADLTAGGPLLWSECPMNRGASGGPLLVRDAGGRWTVAGVSSLCEGVHRCDPWSARLASVRFDARFAAFWTRVAALRAPRRPR